MILVESDMSGEWDSSIDWAALADQAVRSAIADSRHRALAEREIEVSVKFASDEEVRALNAAWRGKDKPTNVLSFPMIEAGFAEAAAAPGGLLLGDIVLAHGVCASEAAEKRVAVRDHAAHLIVHGTLHLLGYDHETVEEDAEEMEEAERRALAAIGIADPYEAAAHQHG